MAFIRAIDLLLSLLLRLGLGNKFGVSNFEDVSHDPTEGLLCVVFAVTLSLV